ncbi:MAG: integrase [Acidobacteria bacterium]|nr:MAG: integrase [Acidobacteriota bacterium]
MRWSRIRIRGPLASHLPGLWQTLDAQGYTALSIGNLARLFAHLSRWLADHALTAVDLDRVTIERFVGDRRAAGYTGYRCLGGLASILDYLRQVAGAPGLAGAPAVSSPNDERLDAYREYLERERVLVRSTVNFYLRVAREVLPADGDLSRLDAAKVTSDILAASHHYGINATKYRVTALRTLLRYLFVRGELAHDLVGAVPCVAGWRLSGLPRDLEPPVVAQLLRGCDRRTHIGRRAYAAVLLMVRLGLRVGEVAALQLEDVDWRAGEISIHTGKARRVDRLPLPADVGAAVAAYVRWSRPRIESRALFLRVRGPHGPVTTTGLQGIVHQAYRRAGLLPLGTHRLRHTAASQMLRQGSSLTEIAQVLRHRHVGTTAIYAKVDRVALQELAQPWPGCAS